MATGNSFVPLNLDLIEEGDFKAALNAHLAKAQKELVEFVERWGERAGKAKASLEMTIVLECQSVEDGVFSISPTLKLKLPARPCRATAAMSGYDRKAQQAVLFVRDTGSTPGDPTQMHLPRPDRIETDSRSEA